MSLVLCGAEGRIDHLRPITLTELDDAAALQVRVDRKYIVTAEQLGDLIDDMATRLAVLDIDGQRSFGYESVYFDTPQLDAFYGSAYRRRHRFKVRTRTYLDTATTRLEVKTRGARRLTVKVRQAHDFADRAALNAPACAFVDRSTERPGLGATLWPTLTTRYRRTTLVDLDDVARLTIDADLTCVDWMRNEIGLTDRFIVETKSSGRPSTADRCLWRAGARPDKVSKYGTGLAALNSSLPSNKWHRTIERHFAAQSPQRKL